jgi:hypothetical protein
VADNKKLMVSLNNFPSPLHLLGVDTEHLRLPLPQEIRGQVDMRQVRRPAQDVAILPDLEKVLTGCTSFK